MTTGTACNEVETAELSDAQALAMFDKIAQRSMGLSGLEFLRRWDDGEWTEQDLDSVEGLIDVWMALPAVR